MHQPRSHLSPLLVGRDDLLALAEELIAAVAAGRGAALLLAGEAGVGKTRLLAAILRKALAAGFRVAKADLAPADREVPMASILDLARTMRGTGTFGALGDELLGLRGGRGADNVGSRRLLVRDAADRMLAATDVPTLLAFEDLQWADELSLEVVAELARLAPDGPLLVLGTYRSDELPAESIHREWRARLLSQRHATEVRLGPLTYEQTALVTSLILGRGLPAPREVVKAVFERTDGIPLYIEELLGALDDDARNDDHAIRHVNVPDTIEDAVRARAARLSDDARAVARAGAVIGRCFVPEVLAGILDRPLAELEEPLDELVRNAFLLPFDVVDRGYYDFRHQLIRDSLYATVPPRDLRRLHARAAEFGTQLVGASEIHASVHFERAGLRAQAFRAAVAGAEAAAALSSRREAFELYRRAIANLPEELSAREVGRVFSGYADAALAIDNVSVATDAAEQARRGFLEAGMPLEAAAAVLDLMMARRRDAQPLSDRERLLDQVESELAPLPASTARTAVLADLRELRGHVALDGGQVGDARRWLQDAADLRSSTDPHADCDARYFSAMCDVAGGDASGLQAMLEVAREARARGIESTSVTAYRMAASLAVHAMDYPLALIGLEEGLRYADEIEQSYCRRILAATAAHVAWASGRWDDAVETAELELAEPGSRRSSVAARDVLAYVALGRGDLGRARELLKESLDVGRRGGEAELTLPALWGLAEIALLAELPSEAVALCREALDVARKTRERWLLLPFVVTGTRAALADHRPDLAEGWRRSLEHQVALPASASAAAPAFAHADGLVRLASGAPGVARPLLDAAVRGWDERGRTWESMWARADLARCMVRAGRHAEAFPIVAAARGEAERLGSLPVLAELEGIEIQARRRGTPLEPWAPLTVREYQVARHIATGMTNKDVAAQLGVAPRTVSAHVEHILAKLGVSRRTEIASWVSMIGAAPAGIVTARNELEGAGAPDAVRIGARS